MKDIYIVTTNDGYEFAFFDLEVLEEFIKPLQNGSFYFRKVQILEDQYDLNSIKNNEQQNQPQ